MEANIAAVERAREKNAHPERRGDGRKRKARLGFGPNWYPPVHSGEEHQWSIGPGIGVQWGL